MEYAAPRYTPSSRRSLLAPLVALLVGAGIAVGGFALFDDETTVQAPDKVVFVDTPGPGQGVRGLDDMATGSATIAQPKVVVPYMSHGLGTQSGEAKNEASTAAAIGAGSKTQDTTIPTDPHGAAAQLHQR
jgi:hypothetical protein